MKTSFPLGEICLPFELEALDNASLSTGICSESIMPPEDT